MIAKIIWGIGEPGQSGYTYGPEAHAAVDRFRVALAERGYTPSGAWVIGALGGANRFLTSAAFGLPCGLPWPTEAGAAATRAAVSRIAECAFGGELISVAFPRTPAEEPSR